MASRYRLLDRIAVGATAEVFRAVAVDDGERPVVIKRVLPQRASDPRFRKMFEAEASLIAQLSHDGIVKLLDFGEMNGTCFLALEPVDGVDLASLVVDGPLPTALCAWIGARLAAALGAAHERGVIHRDVSTRNVLASVDGEVKVVDFGLSAGPTTETWQGTLATVSPEQLRGESVDARTDIYAIGAVLHECATGRPPYASVDEIRAGELTLPGDPLFAVIRRCLARSPEDRFQDAWALESALDEILSTRLVPIGAPELAERVRSAQARTRAHHIDRVAQELLHDGGFAMERTAIQKNVQAAPAPRRSWVPTVIAASLASVVAVMITVSVLDRDKEIVILEQLPSQIDAVPRTPARQADPPEPSPGPEHVVDAPRVDAPTRPRVVSVQNGTLTVNSIPWAKVYLDGRYVGDTPLTKARVAAGKHKLVLRDESGRVMRELTTTITHNTETRHSFELGR